MTLASLRRCPNALARRARRLARLASAVVLLVSCVGAAGCRSGRDGAGEANPVVARVGPRPITLQDVLRARAHQRLLAQGPGSGGSGEGDAAQAEAVDAGPAWVGVAPSARRATAALGADGNAAPSEPNDASASPGTIAVRPADPNAVEAELRRAVLQQLVEQALLGQAAQEAHVAVLTDEVDAAWNQLVQGWPPAELQAALRSLELTVPQLQAQLRRRLLARKVLRAEALARVVVRDEDIDAYVTAHPELAQAPEALRLRQLVVPDEARVDEALLALKKHAPFADVAAKLSMAPEASAGGELGLLTREELPQAIAELCFALRSRQVSRPLRAEDGWHLFFVDERLPARPRPRSELRLMAERRLRAEREVQAAADYLARLAQQAHVELDVERLHPAAR